MYFTNNGRKNQRLEIRFISVPMMCWFVNNKAETEKNKTGALYNAYVIDPKTNGNKNVCPVGFHVPNTAELEILITKLGGYNEAGGKLKQTDTTFWLAPNKNASNETGFSALPGGHRNYGGFYQYRKGNGLWWVVNEEYENFYQYFILFNEYSIIHSNHCYKSMGMSVRCLKD